MSEESKRYSMDDEAMCNQCGRTTTFREITESFNAGYGPVHVCLNCKPPGTAAEIVRDMGDWMGMVSEGGLSRE